MIYFKISNDLEKIINVSNNSGFIPYILTKVLTAIK